MERILQLLTGALVAIFAVMPANAQDNIARIGVLAFRGADSAREEWQPLAQYLTQSVDGWTFEIVPQTLVSAAEAIKANQLEFLITNPGHYVTLAPEFGLGPLATREKPDRTQGTGLMRFGTAIFVRRDSGIQALDGLRGKSVAAVSPEAFGGFQLAWQEFDRQGIDPFRDFESLRFMGFPQDAIIMAVLNNEIDAGIVRSGLLESLAMDGQINLSDFIVLQNNSQLNYPYMVSGQLVPEWPFTAVPGIDKMLREAVSHALLATQEIGPEAENELGQIWTAPLSYEGVRALTNAYHARKDNQQFWVYVATGIGGFFILVALIIWRRPVWARVAPAPLPETPEDPEFAKYRARFAGLTKREREVLSLICKGFASKEIALQLGISPKTIEYHRANLIQKTKAGTTAQMVQLATRFELT